MAISAKYEILSTLERPATRNRRTPWKWEGQIILSGLNSNIRLRLELPVGGGQYEIIPVSGIVEAGSDPQELRSQIKKIFTDKIAELKSKAALPQTETEVLPTNNIVKNVLTVIGDLP